MQVDKIHPRSSRDDFSYKLFENRFSADTEQINLCIQECAQKTGTPIEKVKKLLMESYSPRYLRVLSGPNAFYLFKNVAGRKILLLGEEHLTAEICRGVDNSYEIQEWLRDISFVTDRCLDVFIELLREYDFFEEKGWSSEYLAKGGKKLEEVRVPLMAVSSVIRKFKTKTTRYHFSDLRAIDLLNNTLNRIMFKDSYVEEYDRIGKKFHRRKILESIAGMYTTSDYHDAYTRELFEIVKPSIYDPDTLLSRFSHSSNIIRNDIAKRIRKLDKKIDAGKFIGTLIDIHLQDDDRFFSELTFVMDLYLLLRIFTKFTKTRETPGDLCENINPQNIIVYTGSKHTETYKKFFEIFFGSKHAIIPFTKMTDQCLVFSDPFDFLS